MQYYQARQIKGQDGGPSGLWHYTVKWDKQIHAVGYCAQGCPGHLTEAEAQEHYKAYLLDTNLHLDQRLHDEQRKCKVCGAWTQGQATIPTWYFTAVLCDEHRTREHVVALLTVGNVMMS